MRGGGVGKCQERGEGEGEGWGNRCSMRKKGSILCCTCVHVTQAVADSLVFLQEFGVTYGLWVCYSTYLSHKKLCKTNSFHGLVIGLFDFFSSVYKFSSASGICETLRERKRIRFYWTKCLFFRFNLLPKFRLNFAMRNCTTF